MKRRELLKHMGLTAGAVALCGTPMTIGVVSAAEQKRKRALRIAHITDCHVTDHPSCLNGMKKVMEQLNSMKDRPQLIINSGDIIMEANNKSKEEAETLWNLWDELVKENKIPIHYCPGNHDYWWPKDKDLAAKENPDFNQGLYLRRSAMPAPYYTFENQGWKFISLNSMDKWYALGEEQFSWLEEELMKAGNQPVCIFSHVPIISITPLMYNLNRQTYGDIRYSGDQHKDARQLKDLFYKTGNVKLCLSGHMHYIDAVDYIGVKYICSGSASASWWGGILDEFPHVYTIIDLYEDGGLDYQFVYYNQ